MEKCPTPCVIISKTTQHGATESFELLELGAVEVIGKPSKKEIDRNISSIGNIIIKKVKQAKYVDIKKILQQINQPHVILDKGPIQRKEKSFSQSEQEGIVVIGSSTGGPQTLSHIISHIPEDFPFPIIIAQHIPENFSNAFAERLNKLSHIQVKEAVNREVIRPGNVYVSPGGKNILVKKVNDDYIIKISTDDEDLNLPNINKLFSSASECFGKNSFGVILTGMGEDGSIGLKDIKDCGGLTLVQEPTDAVIGGMPSAAQKAVPSCFVMNSEKIIPFLVNFIRGR
jgi:two-component system chemotaxis response regulator CheB